MQSEAVPLFECFSGDEGIPRNELIRGMIRPKTFFLPGLYKEHEEETTQFYARVLVLSLVVTSDHPSEVFNMADQGAPIPVKVVPLEPERDEALRKAYPGIKNGFMRGEPGHHLMFTDMWGGMQKMYNFEVRPDDVWLAGILKSGTTWLQEMVYLINMDCNFELARSIPMLRRVPSFEMSYSPYAILDAAGDEKSSGSKTIAEMVLTIDELNKMDSPRHFKTHFPFHLLPRNVLSTAKVVYIARNPKDLIVSYYNYHQLVTKLNFNGSLEEFAEFFMRDEVNRTPYFAHVLEAWNHRHLPNVHFLFYEDLKSDLRGELVRLAKFLGKELSEEQLQALREHLTFDNCKKNIKYEDIFKDTGLMKVDKLFFRKGKAGDWKNHFSPELSARLDQWIAKNLEGTDLSFKMELEQQD